MRRVTQQSGFTIVELVMVMVIIGVLAVVAIPRLTPQSAFDLAGFQQELGAGLRYAQKYAFASGCPVRVAVSGTGFELRRSSTCDGGDFSVPLRHPSRGGGYTVTTPTGLSLSSTTFTFNGGGNASTSTTITLTSGAGTRQVAVIGPTGYVDLL